MGGGGGRSGRGGNCEKDIGLRHWCDPIQSALAIRERPVALDGMWKVKKGKGDGVSNLSQLLKER